MFQRHAAPFTARTFTVENAVTGRGDATDCGGVIARSTVELSDATSMPVPVASQDMRPPSGGSEPTVMDRS